MSRDLKDTLYNKTKDRIFLLQLKIITYKPNLQTQFTPIHSWGTHLKIGEQFWMQSHIEVSIKRKVNSR